VFNSGSRRWRVLVLFGELKRAADQLLGLAWIADLGAPPLGRPLRTRYRTTFYRLVEFVGPLGDGSTLS